MKNLTFGIVIGRMNPIHIGHIHILRKSLEENDVTLVFLGVALHQDERNFLTFDERSKLLYCVFSDDIEKKKLYIDDIRDRNNDALWTQDLAQKIKKYLHVYGDMQGNVLNFYGGDIQNDSALIAIQSYISLFGNNVVHFHDMKRYNCFIEHNGQKIDVSATNLRSALREKNEAIIDKMVDIKMKALLFEFWYKNSF